MHNYVIYGIIITLVYLCDKSSILSMNLCNGSNIFTLAVTMIHLPHGEIKDEQRTLVTSVHVHITDIIRLQNSPYFCVNSSTRKQSNKRPCFTDFFTDFEKKKQLFCSLKYIDTTKNCSGENIHTCTVISFYSCMNLFLFIFLIPTGKYNYACFDSKKKVEFCEYKDVRKKNATLPLHQIA